MRYPFLFLLAFLIPLSTSVQIPSPLYNKRLANLFPIARQTHDTANIPRVPSEFNINSGGPSDSRFLADHSTWLVGLTETFTNNDALIGGAEDKNLIMYKSHRFGVDGASWGYDIPVADPGVYGCTVHFAEIDAASFERGSRVFDLSIATSYGQPTVFPAIDIINELNGAEFTALTKTVVDLVVPGFLNIRVVPSAGNAIISGITCERTADLPEGVEPEIQFHPDVPVLSIDDPIMSTIEPSAATGTVIGAQVNINAGGPSIGRFAEEDYAWIFGSTSFWGGPEGIEIGGAEEQNRPALISQRYGLDSATWGYRIPVEVPAIYDCSAHFAETDSASFSVGARVFNVRMQETVIEGIDVFNESGGAAFTSVVKTFTGLTATTELYIELSAVNGNAFLSALTCERTALLAPEVTPAFAITPEPSMHVLPTPDIPPTEGVEPSPIVTPALDEVPLGPTTFSPAPLAISTNDAGETPAASVAPEVSGTDGTIDPIETPTIGDPVETPVTGDAGDVVETPTSSDVVETPTPETSTGSQDEEVPQSPNVDNVSPDPNGAGKDGPGFSPPPPSFVESDPSSIEATEDQRVDTAGEEVEYVYNMRGTVTDGGVFTMRMKDEILKLSRESSEFTTSWAMTSIKETSPPTSRMLTPSYRQNNQGRKYGMSVQAIYMNTSTLNFGLAKYAQYVGSKMNEDLESNGVRNLQVEIDTPVPPAPPRPDTASTSRTSTIVGVVVGVVLGALVTVALVAFFVVRRARSAQSNAAFEGPPPVMESESSSVMERSETGASLEYIDDDSTFTAATSRAGETADQMTIDKDFFGRRPAGEASTDQYPNA